MPRKEKKRKITSIYCDRQNKYILWKDRKGKDIGQKNAQTKQHSDEETRVVMGQMKQI